MAETKQSTRILIVDDNIEDLELMEQMLRPEGYQVTTAASGHQAMELLSMQSYEVILCDLVIPDIPGTEILRFAHSRDPKAVSVVMTAFPDPKSALECMKEGAFDFLSKPAGYEMLKAVVRRAASHSHLRRAFRERSERIERLEAELDTASADLAVGEPDREKNVDLDHVAAVAHELKSPLAVILGYASFLLRAEAAQLISQPVRKAMRAVQNSCESMDEILKDLFLGARGVDAVRIKPQRMTVLPFIKAAVEGFQVLARENAITLVSGSDAGELAAYMDPGRIRQVLNNLIANALRHTPKGGNITLWASRQGPEVRFSVLDTGCGIPAGELAHIFEPFYRCKQTRGKAGMGLGLHLAKKFVEKHGGRIWVESGAGQGARFFFTVPEATAKESQAGVCFPPAACQDALSAAINLAKSEGSTI